MAIARKHVIVDRAAAAETATAAYYIAGVVPDYGTLPPEINSARMYSGPGSAPMLAAAMAWDRLADNLYSAAASYRWVIAGLTGHGWLGPASAAMADAATVNVSWMTAAAAHAAQIADQARRAATAYETAFAMTVPPPVIAANRAQLALLGVQNAYGQDAHAIAEKEADYHGMWAQDATAMYGYAEQSAMASTLTPFSPPQQTANPATQAVRADHASLKVPQVLRRLAHPAHSTLPPSAEVGRAPAVGPLSVPPSWPTTGKRKTAPATSWRLAPKPLRHNATDLIPAWA
jgi:hypothetical protein